jgi:hypothetical protein
MTSSIDAFHSWNEAPGRDMRVLLGIALGGIPAVLIAAMP